jgi:hypothetical protein
MANNGTIVVGDMIGRLSSDRQSDTPQHLRSTRSQACKVSTLPATRPPGSYRDRTHTG